MTGDRTGDCFSMGLGCIRLFVVSLVLSFGFSAGLCGGSIVAFAQSGDSRGLDLLSRATRSFDAGAYSDASSLIDAAFRAGLSGELAARAILLRARINERSGSYARALQDYSNALWMESLPAADRKTANEGKERVMAAMGLSPQQQQASAPTQANQPAQGRSRHANNPAPNQAPASQPDPQSSPSQAQSSSGGGIGGFFDSIFGGSSGGQQAAQAQQPQQQGWQAQASASQQQQAAASAVVVSPAPTRRAAPIRIDPSLQADAPAKPARVAKATPPAKVSTPPVTPVSTATSASSVAAPADGFLIVFGSAPSQQAGQATARQIKAQLSDILVNRDLDVESGAGGYRIQAGPYKAKAAATALCGAIRQRNIPCSVTP
ncbi:SPOR domain-containing protein [Rhodomicrobium lacus]|uniref:SPOR domain-containing protein n=1 Tax=Rhodomicrobium lacus TaxID=2498452 RepID=UPI0026E32F04|nr:SPOR domain-containing protein [Rhodomicrobium lacus]WKW51581.1 SPOR domain-containing protein [Rhodomicrobium lacus]